jgi:hypothetical protein
MTKRTKRKIDAALKAKIALAVLREEATIALTGTAEQVALAMPAYRVVARKHETGRPGVRHGSQLDPLPHAPRWPDDAAFHARDASGTHCRGAPQADLVSARRP